MQIVAQNVTQQDTFCAARVSPQVGHGICAIHMGAINTPVSLGSEELETSIATSPIFHDPQIIKMYGAVYPRVII